MMNLAKGMKNNETRYSGGYCGCCNKTTNAIWERSGNRLSISCQECGTIYEENDNYFKDKHKQKE